MWVSEEDTLLLLKKMVKIYIHVILFLWLTVYFSDFWNLIFILYYIINYYLRKAVRKWKYRREKNSLIMSHGLWVLCNEPLIEGFKCKLEHYFSPLLLIFTLNIEHFWMLHWVTVTKQQPPMERCNTKFEIQNFSLNYRTLQLTSFIMAHLFQMDAILLLRLTRLLLTKDSSCKLGTGLNLTIFHLPA